MPDADLCVVIVNDGTAPMTIDCLETLVPQVHTLGARVALVDNTLLRASTWPSPVRTSPEALRLRVSSHR